MCVYIYIYTYLWNVGGNRIKFPQERNPLLPAWRYTRVTVLLFPIIFLQLCFTDRPSILNWTQMEQLYFREILPFSSNITIAVLRNGFRPRDLNIFDGKTNVWFNSYNCLRYALDRCWYLIQSTEVGNLKANANPSNSHQLRWRLEVTW